MGDMIAICIHCRKVLPKQIHNTKDPIKYFLDKQSIWPRIYFQGHCRPVSFKV